MANGEAIGNIGVRCNPEMPTKRGGGGGGEAEV